MENIYKEKSIGLFGWLGLFTSQIPIVLTTTEDFSSFIINNKQCQFFLFFDFTLNFVLKLRANFYATFVLSPSPKKFHFTVTTLNKGTTTENM